MSGLPSRRESTYSISSLPFLIQLILFDGSQAQWFHRCLSNGKSTKFNGQHAHDAITVMYLDDT